MLNAANEVAVQAFLDKRIRFDQIHQVNRRTLDGWTVPAVTGVGDLLEIDREARQRADGFVKTLET